MTSVSNFSNVAYSPTSKVGIRMVELTEVTRVALASATKHRSLFHATFGLDTLLGRVVLGSNEPIVSQIRLAWWREKLQVLSAGALDRDPLTALIQSSWGMDTSPLIKLIDGWESFIVEPKRPMFFVSAKAELVRAIAEKVGSQSDVDGAVLDAKLWAYADLANIADEMTRAWALQEWRKLPSVTHTKARELRPLRVLGGLARRSLENGGKPMLGDRMSPLVALRLGLWGK